MPNSTISQITLPSGTTYDIKDAQARNDIANLQSMATGAMYYMGISTTVITDNGVEHPTIDDEERILGTNDAGAVVIYGEKEYVWNGSKWQEFGSTGSLKSLAFKDSATGNFTPAGTISQPTFSNGTCAATGSVTAEGSVTAPTINLATAGTTTTVNSITDVGSLPAWSATVSGETLTIGWNAGSLPTKGSDTTVKIGDASYEATIPTFTGSAVSVNVTGTAEGTISQPTFNGTQGTISVS